MCLDARYTFFELTVWESFEQIVDKMFKISFKIPFKDKMFKINFKIPFKDIKLGVAKFVKMD